MILPLSLRKDIDNIISIIGSDHEIKSSVSASEEKNPESSPSSMSSAIENDEAKEVKQEKVDDHPDIKVADSIGNVDGSAEALVIITSLVTSCIR